MEGYGEIWEPIGDQAEFPETCPVCGAGTILQTESRYHGPVYACLGQYVLKSQIQNHTDKWWGVCQGGSMTVAGFIKLERGVVATAADFARAANDLQKHNLGGWWVLDRVYKALGVPRP